LSSGLLFADPTGRLRGTVKDSKGNPIDKVKITIEATGEVPQKYSAVTNAKGEYIHIGIKPGDYKVTPSKEGYAPVDYAFANLHIPPSDRPEKVDFVMQPQAAAVAAVQEEKKQIQEQNKSAQEGIKLINEGKYDQAIAELQKVLQSDPNLAAAHYNLGVAYERKKELAEAEKHYLDAIKLKPDFGEAYLSLGNTYLSGKKLEDAMNAFAKATQLLPDSYEAFYNLGASSANLMKYAEAEAAFRKATQLNPNEPVAHYQLGMALYGQSKNAEAKVEFQKYLELNPNAADKKEVEELLSTL
jgi:tetratricopeptide (TPR) repeat protein